MGNYLTKLFGGDKADKKPDSDDKADSNNPYFNKYKIAKGNLIKAVKSFNKDCDFNEDIEKGEEILSGKEKHPYGDILTKSMVQEVMNNPMGTNNKDIGKLVSMVAPDDKKIVGDYIDSLLDLCKDANDNINLMEVTRNLLQIYKEICPKSSGNTKSSFDALFSKSNFGKGSDFTTAPWIYVYIIAGLLLLVVAFLVYNRLYNKKNTTAGSNFGRKTRFGSTRIRRW